MTQICYLNGRYIPYHQANISIFDRAYLFSDGVYEVITGRNNKYFYLEEHLDRLEKSLIALNMDNAVSRFALKNIITQLVKKNKFSDFIIYIQISREDGARDHCYSKEFLQNIFISCRYLPIHKTQQRANIGIKILSQEDQRWKNVGIKSVSLLANILGKTKAKRAGAFDMLFYKNNYFTETSAANFWIIDKNGTFVTHPANGDILDGITKNCLLSYLRNNKEKIDIRKIKTDEIHDCQVAFLSSASIIIMPITQIDDIKIPSMKNKQLYCQYSDLYYANLETLKND